MQEGALVTFRNRTIFNNYWEIRFGKGLLGYKFNRLNKIWFEKLHN